MAKNNVKPFGMRDKIGYMFGDIGNDFTFLLSSSFLMKFYTDIMGVDAAIVGIAMMVARFVDAFTDVMMGRICDRSKMTPVGKFKPWIRRMCGPLAISSFLIYQSGLANMPMSFKIVYLFVTYILWGSIFYTSVNIPYGSMASAISGDPNDRQSLSTFRTIGGSLAGVVLGAGIPMIVYDHVDGVAILNGGKFTIVAGICSALAIVCYMICYTFTTERVKPDVDLSTSGQQENVLVMLKKALTNRSLISVIAASIALLLAQLTIQGMANYVYPNYYGNTTAQSVSMITMLVGMLISGALAKPLAAKFGKAEVGAVASALAAIVCIILLALRPENVWVYVAIQMVNWIGLGMYSMVSWALIGDVIDATELQKGIREDGSVYALYSFARKLGQAASSGLTGSLLAMVGYSAATAFDTKVVNGIYNIACIVPAIGFLALALILWFWYPLHKKQVDANVAALKMKHGE